MIYVSSRSVLKFNIKLVLNVWLIIFSLHFLPDLYFWNDPKEKPSTSVDLWEHRLVDCQITLHESVTWCDHKLASAPRLLKGRPCNNLILLSAVAGSTVSLFKHSFKIVYILSSSNWKAIIDDYVVFRTLIPWIPAFLWLSFISALAFGILTAIYCKQCIRLRNNLEHLSIYTLACLFNDNFTARSYWENSWISY